MAFHGKRSIGALAVAWLDASPRPSGSRGGYRNPSQHPKGFGSPISVRHLLPDLSRFNRYRCVHARPARSETVAVAYLMANHVLECDARQGRPRVPHHGRWAAE